MPATAPAPPVRELSLADGTALGYRELGAGPPALLVHGWPTSSFVWRAVMPPIARRNRVIALDLPGYGASDKPVDGDYGFDGLAAAIDGALDALGVDRVAIAGHDLGGPIVLHWALRRPGRATRLALLNTLVYPDFSEAVLRFVAALAEPQSRDWLTGPEGLAAAMQLGMAADDPVSEEVLAAVREPFSTADDRLALARAGVGLDPGGFEALARGLPSIDIPVLLLYGTRDRILPDVAETMARLERDLPRVDTIALEDCGHFLQEERPARVGEALAAFFERRNDVSEGNR